MSTWSPAVAKLVRTAVGGARENMATFGHVVPAALVLVGEDLHLLGLAFSDAAGKAESLAFVAGYAREHGAQAVVFLGPAWAVEEGCEGDVLDSPDAREAVVLSLSVPGLVFTGVAYVTRTSPGAATIGPVRWTYLAGGDVDASLLPPLAGDLN